LTIRPSLPARAFRWPWNCSAQAEPEESGHGGACPRRYEERAGGWMFSIGEVRGERRMVPFERDLLQPFEPFEAGDVTRRILDSQTEAVAVFAVEHG